MKKTIGLLNAYKMPPKAVDTVSSTRILFLVGISGAGKDTVLRKLLDSDKYQYIVSHTTRHPRYNKGKLEEDGIDYYFIDSQTAASMLDKKEFVEAKLYGNNIYGTTVAEIEKARRSGKIAVTDIEVQGVAEYKAAAPNVVTVFLLPPDFDTWQTRLKARYADKPVDQEDMNKRMHTAKIELQEALDKDYFEFVINDDLGRAVKAVDDIAGGEISKLKNDEAKKLARSLLEGLNA
jgi:guanylate kinase